MSVVAVVAAIVALFVSMIGATAAIVGAHRLVGVERRARELAVQVDRRHARRDLALATRRAAYASCVRQNRIIVAVDRLDEAIVGVLRDAVRAPQPAAQRQEALAFVHRESARLRKVRPAQQRCTRVAGRIPTR